MTGGDDCSDTNSLTQPLVGENPTYMDRCMGTHVQEKSYHKFTNPLYARTAAQPTPARDIATYSYPRMRSHLFPSVYLPGDDSPLSASLSGTPSHTPPTLPPANGHTPPSQQAGSESDSVHYEQQQPPITDGAGTTSQNIFRDSHNYVIIREPQNTEHGQDPKIRQSAPNTATSEGREETSEPPPSP